jgi:hypothetical protein
MEKEQFNAILGRFLLVFIFVGLLICSIIYLNSRWSRIRDIRRQADAQAIIKALKFYDIQYNNFPVNNDDDGEGGDKSNNQEERSFLEPLILKGLFVTPPFDPKNNEEYYYRYQKFPAGAFGCMRPFAVFQITQFETKNMDVGEGECQNINFTQLAPNGFTWQEFD